MAKISAGLLIYRRRAGQVEVLLGHGGGPYWAKKDKGAWTIPKGELDDGEELLAAAYREFEEELGKKPPTGEPIELGSFKNSRGKTIHAWAIEGDMDVTSIDGNLFEMEWPPKSGQMQKFPEVDRAEWFTLERAPAKMHQGQKVFIERLAQHLGVAYTKPEQATLF